MIAIILLAVILISAFAVSASASCGTQAQCCSGGCMTYSASDIAQFARNSGFSGCDLVIAVAVALAESGGNARAYNPESAARGGTPQGQGSYGLWQIYEKQHPEFQGEDLFDPQKNAQAAFDVYSAAGNSFAPWATFDPHDCTTPLYISHLPAATQGVNA